MIQITDEEQKLYRQCIDRWGEDMQLLLLIEEMAELTQALSKSARASHDNKFSPRFSMVIEELADVTICIEQIITMLQKTAVTDRPTSLYLDYLEGCRKQKKERIVKCLETPTPECPPQRGE